MTATLAINAAGLLIAAAILAYSIRIILNLRATPEEAFVVFFQHWRATTSFRIMTATFFLLAAGMMAGSLRVVVDSAWTDVISQLFVGVALLGILGFLRNVAIVTTPD